MSLEEVLFLAAYTDRSRVYAQAMARAGLTPGRVLLFGDAAADWPRRPVPAGAGSEFGGMVVPDLGQPLADTCARAGWSVDRVAASDVNHPEVAKRLASIKPRLAVYSGYGGQLVEPALLRLGFDILHVHAGWLPDYRGSTTVYYSCLAEGHCGATALLLDDGIDSGPIVARRHYPLPPPGLDVDRLYDGMIRADLLTDVLKTFAADGELSTAANDGDGDTYYVIHPVLKHLVLLSRESAP